MIACVFHLNLAFSSLDAERRPEVVRRCYRPLLALPERTGFPLGIEAAGWTLERIAELDPEWIEEARRLLAADMIELVGGGHSQIAAPLVPAAVNAMNLRLGLEDAERLLGARPRVALLAEQAYAPGLVDLHAEAGFEAIIADWDNAARSNPGWDDAVRRRPQRAIGTRDTLPVIWSESIAFQRFQRMAHGELDPGAWVAWVRERGPLLAYANDAEVFDFRPGRFAAEPPPGEGEWERIATALSQLDGVLPSALLDGGGDDLRLESAAHPIPVKKQDKYTVARWAVTGRDDIGLNTDCVRRHIDRTDDPRTLVERWSSDLRTHITDARWSAVTIDPPPPPAPVAGSELALRREGQRLVGDGLVLNLRRGLAIEDFAGLVGTVEHGYYPAIDLGADWYTGNVVQERPGQHKVADLNPVEPELDATSVTARIPTPLGEVEKRIARDGDDLVLDVALHWPELPEGSLRVNVTLLPWAFDRHTLFYATHNGGRHLEHHPLGGVAFDHGRAVSALVSSRQGVGMTEGVIHLGDATRHIAVEVDRTVAAPLGLVAFRPVNDTFFLRLSLSLCEHDDTRRGPIPRSAPQRLRVRLSPRAGAPPR